jgi:hypothetical protein
MKTLARMSIVVALVGLSTQAGGAGQQSVPCDSCLQITAVRVGTRCGTSNSMEVDVVNTANLPLRGYVVFQTASGKSYEPTGLLQPGEENEGTQFVCRATGRPYAIAQIGADPNYPPRR